MKKQCLVCKKEFKTYPSLIKKGKGKTCSRKCFFKLNSKPCKEETKLKIGLANKGKKSHRKGGYLTEEHKKKISLAHMGMKVNEKTKQKMGLFLKGKTGIKSIAWKGGRTKIKILIRTGLQYKQWRQSIFIRDNFTCQKCKIKGGKLEVHHIKPFSKLLEEVKQNLPLLDLYSGAMIYTPLWDLDNGITLCKKCHRIKNDIKYNKQN